MIKEDEVKSKNKVGGESDNSERLTEEKEIFTGWEKNNDEKLVEEDDDDREKIDVISDIHGVIGSLGVEG